MKLVNIKSGDVVKYQNEDKTLIEEKFKVKDIIDMEMQVKLILVNKYNETLESNFWKSDYQKNPNIMYDSDTDKYSLLDIKIGQTINAVGYEYDYKGKKQFNAVGGYEVLDEEFEFQSPIDRKFFFDRIIKAIHLIDDVNLRNTCEQGLKHLGKDFIIKPAATKHHHNYPGGLLQHTSEVVEFAISLSTGIVCNLDVIIAASLFHDFMKVAEYTIEGETTDYQKFEGHVIGSANLFSEIAIQNNVDKSLIDEIYHCILSHHGQVAWGSPIEPFTVEASIVHAADYLSAKINPIATRNNLEKDCYIRK